MNYRFNNWLTIAITGIVGILFIVCFRETDLFSWLIRLLGVSLMLPGIYMVIETIGDLNSGNAVKAEITTTEVTETKAGRKATTRRTSSRGATLSMLIVSACSILVGLWMLIAPGFFVGLFAYLLAAVMIIMGIYQLTAAIYAARPGRLPWSFYIVPSLLIVAGLVIFLSPVRTINAAVSLITGILLVLTAFNAAAQRIAINRLNRQMRKEQAQITAGSEGNDE